MVDMPLENEVARDVRISRGWKLEAVAHLTGYSVSHISAIELGQRRAVPLYLRALWQATLDLRIPQTVAPNVVEVIRQALLSDLPATPPQTPERVPPPGDPRELLSRLLAAMSEFTKVAQYAEQIVRDGKIDESDDTAITSYLGHSNHVVQAIADANRALMHWRDQAEQKRD